LDKYFSDAQHKEHLPGLICELARVSVHETIKEVKQSNQTGGSHSVSHENNLHIVVVFSDATDLPKWDSFRASNKTFL
jgi:hypothetical protein